MNARNTKAKTGSTFSAILASSPDLQVQCSSESDGEHHWLRLEVWTESRKNIAADAYEIAALTEWAVPQGEKWTFREAVNLDHAVEFIADLQVGDAAEKARMNAFLTSSSGWSHTDEDVLGQTHSLSAKLVRRSWMVWEAPLVDYVPGMEFNWDGVDPGLAIEVPEGTPASKRTALVFALAMKVQHAIPSTERWVVNTSVTGNHAFVTLQLVTPEFPEPADAAEVARCMAILHQVASGK